jgi:Na+-transporting NADH:ubiquinone oxidoreductase subunit NqrB
MPARRWLEDARHWQIAALGTLLTLNIAWLDFGAKPLNSALAVGAALATQALCSRAWRLPSIDLRSPLITGFSLSLLLRADAAWVFALAGMLGVASKFVLRHDGKHLWNPATFAIVALLFGTSHVWISPGQWGSAVWFAALLGFLAILVLQRSRRADTALFFLGVHGALLCWRAAWLGDPWTIPLHQLESGSLLLFSFFMVTDPRTTPDHRLGRFVFAASVALLAHWLAFFEQMRPALYLALFALAPLVPVLDRLLPAERFAWRRPVPALASGIT